MTTSESPAESPAAEAAQTEPPIESITTQPEGSPPAVSIGLPSGTVAAGTPTTVNLFVDHGTTYVPVAGGWQPRAAASFSELSLTIPGVGRFTDHRSTVDNGAAFSITFPGPGVYQLSAFGVTTTGTHIDAPGPRSLSVIAPGPPAFTWVQPADGAVVDVGPGGGQVTVELSTGTDQLYPFTVAIACDGVVATEQFSGTHYAKTINLAPTPLGARSISVTCTDPGGRATTRTRMLMAHDGAPPTVTLDPFSSPATVGSLPFEFVLTGRTPGAQSGVTKVEYAFTNGPSGTAVNTAPGGDLSTWRAVVSLPTTGTYPFTVTATDSRGSTASVSSSIVLQLPATRPLPESAPAPEPEPDPVSPAGPPPVS